MSDAQQLEYVPFALTDESFVLSANEETGLVAVNAVFGYRDARGVAENGAYFFDSYVEHNGMAIPFVYAHGGQDKPQGEGPTLGAGRIVVANEQLTWRGELNASDRARDFAAEFETLAKYDLGAVSVAHLYRLREIRYGSRLSEHEQAIGAKFGYGAIKPVHLAFTTLPNVKAAQLSLNDVIAANEPPEDGSAEDESTGEQDAERQARLQAARLRNSQARNARARNR